MAETWSPAVAIGMTTDWTLATFRQACQVVSTCSSRLADSEAVALAARIVRMAVMSRSTRDVNSPNSCWAAKLVPWTTRLITAIKMLNNMMNVTAVPSRTGSMTSMMTPAPRMSGMPVVPATKIWRKPVRRRAVSLATLLIRSPVLRSSYSLICRRRRCLLSFLLASLTIDSPTFCR